jgi:signal transduction histidine kinase
MAARVGVIARSTDIKAVAEPLARALERINRDRGVTVTLTCPDGASFQGERQDLEEMLGNLLDNACKWARKSVALTVSVPAVEGRPAHQRRVVIRVEDDGPGLTPEQRARIGKRGLRLDESKPGSGLGLSIVADLVVSYRGSMSLGVAEKGGLSVRLELPAA